MTRLFWIETRELLAVGFVLAVFALPPAAVLFASYAAGQQHVWRGLVVEPEDVCAPYSAAYYHYPQSIEQVIQDELGMVVAPRGWYGMYSARLFESGRQTDIEHIVARAEAHRSGMCSRSVREKTAFANDLNNLTLAGPHVNRVEKRDRDAAGWLPLHSRCWFARTVVFVKQTHRLSVDRAERDALQRVLSACAAGRVPAR